MENYRVLTSRKQLTDLERSRSMSGAVAMIFRLLMGRVLKCVLKELSHILRGRFVVCVHLTLLKNCPILKLNLPSYFDSFYFMFH